MDWIINNKEWIFSGIGVFILSIISLLLRSFSKKKSERNINLKGDNPIYIEKNDGKIDIHK